MSTAKRKPTGIRARHSRTCRTREGGGCNCRPSYEAFVFSKRDGRKVRKTFPTQAAAKAWRADKLSALNRGQLRAPRRTTVTEAAEAWLAGAEDGTIRNRNGRRYKPSALRGYRRALDKRVLPALGHLRLSEVRRIDVQDFADRLLRDGHGASTIQNTLDPLRAIFRYAIRREQVAINPCTDLDVPKSGTMRDRIASPDEARALLDAVPADERALWATAFYAGLRRGELRALRWSDVDLPARELHVRRSWDSVEGPIDGKTAAANRTVPIIGALAPELAQHKLRTGRDDDALVFGATAERAFDPSTVRRRALAAWTRANTATRDRAEREHREVRAGELLQPIGLHECRHTFASLMIAAGVNAKAICDAMGHASVTMTFDRYGHLMPDGRGQARDRLDAYLLQAGRAIDSMPGSWSKT
jgi:integrase